MGGKKMQPSLILLLTISTPHSLSSGWRTKICLPWIRVIIQFSLADGKSCLPAFLCPSLVTVELIICLHALMLILVGKHPLTWIKQDQTAGCCEFYLNYWNNFKRCSRGTRCFYVHIMHFKRYIYICIFYIQIKDSTSRFSFRFLTYLEIYLDLVIDIWKSKIYCTVLRI